MDNFLNWYSVEKDGAPKEISVSLVKIKHIHTDENYIPSQVGIDWYYPELGVWDCYNSDNNCCVTHYIPISEIPIPE